MNTRKNLLLGALLLIAIAAAGALYMRGDLDFKKMELAKMPEVAETNDADHVHAAEDFSWKFEDAGEKDGAPQTTVTLMHGTESKKVGTYTGSCAELAAENLQPGQVSGVLCWFAGGGDEIGVFEEGGEYVVKVGQQEESTAESNGFRGDFRTEFTLE
ncbi:MAG: hypothetical protein V4681_00815 [Patescibacteria group bacterium]